MKRLFMLLVAVMALGFGGAAFAVDTADVVVPPDNNVKNEVVAALPAGTNVVVGVVTGATRATVFVINNAAAAFFSSRGGVEGVTEAQVAQGTISNLTAGGMVPFTPPVGRTVALFNFRTGSFVIVGSVASESSVENEGSVSAITNLVDGGDYDGDGAANGVISFVTSTITETPKGGGSSGGGCSALGLGALLVFALPVLAVARRKAK
ncbi:hypothetical protein FACS1894216_19440 [Synergistales bacterium]|nr:hypothetical protein FACS1894216_19440 [Synergistales bacterium]